MRNRSHRILDPLFLFSASQTKDEGSAVAAFAEAAEEIPDDFLRRRLLRIATCPEAFLTLRAEFAKTLAVSNLFGYILGLGDRHLEVRAPFILSSNSIYEILSILTEFVAGSPNGECGAD